MLRLKSSWFWVLMTTLILCAGVLFYWQVWGSVAALVQAIDHCPDLFCDFTRQYYPTGQALFDTGQPSNGYFYTSFFAIFLAGFGLFSLETAVVLWGLFQFASLLLLLLPVGYFRQKQPALALLYVALVLLSMPVMHNLKWGQVSILITGLIFAAFHLYHRGYKGVAAVLLGLATAVKYYAILFALYFLLRKEWRLLLVLLGSVAVFVIIVPILVLGWETNWEFYQTVSQRIAHARTTWMLRDLNSQYLANVMNRLAENVWQTSSPRLLWQVVGLVIAGVGGLTAVALVCQRQPRADQWFLTILFLALPFVTETSWPHYFVFLPFVQVFLLAHLWQKGKRKAWFGSLGILISMLLASMLFFAWVGDRRAYASMGTLLWANSVLFLVTLWLKPQVWRWYGDQLRHWRAQRRG